MLWKVFSVVDNGAKVFMAPFVVRHEAEAVRSVLQAVQSGDSMVSKYPQDFFLFQIGTFDDVTGEMIPFKALNSYGPLSALSATVEALPLVQ